MRYRMFIAALAACIVGCAPTASSTKEASSGNVPAETTEVVKKQDLVGYSFFDGKLVIPPAAQANAFSPYDTPVVSVSTTVGKHVGKGEPIIKLDIPGADQAADAAKANVQSAQSSYAEQKAQESGPVKEAERALADARAAEKQAKDTVASGGTADVDAATQNRIAAETALREAQAALKESLQPTKQVVAQASAELALIKADARKGLVRAPISGTVTALEAKPGMMAKSNQTLATIINYDAVRIQGVVPPQLKDQVAKGSSVIISLNGQSSDPLDGVVRDVSVIPPEQGQSSPGYLAVIALKNPSAIIQPNSVKRIGVKVGQVHDALVVPVGALVVTGDKTIVKVKNGDSWVDTPVQIGISDGALVEIKSGLSEGAVVRVATVPVK